MASVAIGGLPAASAVSLTDLYPTTQGGPGGSTKRATVAQLLASMGAFISSLPADSSAPTTGDQLLIYAGGTTLKSIDGSLIGGGGGGLPIDTAWPTTGGSSSNFLRTLSNGFRGRRLVEYVASGVFPVPINIAQADTYTGSSTPAATWERPVTLGNLMLAFCAGVNADITAVTSGWGVVASSSGPNTYPAVLYKYADSGDVSSPTVAPASFSSGASSVICAEVANAALATAPTAVGGGGIAAVANHLYFGMIAVFDGNADHYEPYSLKYPNAQRILSAQTISGSNWFRMGVIAIPWIDELVQDAAARSYFSPYLTGNNIGAYTVDVAPASSTVDYWTPSGTLEY